MEAPEKMWLVPDELWGGWGGRLTPSQEKVFEEDVLYIRADLVEAKDEEIERLRKIIAKATGEVRVDE